MGCRLFGIRLESHIHQTVVGLWLAGGLADTAYAGMMISKA